MKSRGKLPWPTMASCWGAYLVLAIALRLVVAGAELETRASKPKSTGDASLTPLRMGLWNDDSKPATHRSSNSDGSPSKELQLQVQQQSDTSSTTTSRAPESVNPMILPRHHRQSLNRLGNSLASDSYLDALAYSHASAGKGAGNQELAPAASNIRRRADQFTVGPVYRRPENAESNGRRATNSSVTPVVHSAPKIELKISRISHSGAAAGAGGNVAPEKPGPLHRRTSYGTSSYDSYSYGPPPSSYETLPAYSSAPYAPAYGPPAPSSSGPYALASGASQQGESKGLGSLQATYSTSYPLPDIFPLALFPPIDLSWPISIKIDAFTLIKVVIKLIIFKMIVKFIAAICLLIFIPKLIHKKHGDSYEDESRGFDEINNKSPLERLDLTTPSIIEAIQHYKHLNESMKNTSRQNYDSKHIIWDDDDVGLLRSYLTEERARVVR